MPIKKGNPIVRPSLERSIVSGLSRRKVKVVKNKAHGADVGMCSRKVVMHTLLDPNFEVTMSPASTMYMKIGTAVHEVIAGAFAAEDLLFDDEVSVHGEDIGPPAFPALHGYIDDVIRDEDEVYAIVDVKTCGKLPSRIKPWHGEQLGTYAILSGATKGYVLYFSRNVAQWGGALIQRAFEVEFNTGNLASVAEQMATSHYFLQTGEVPPIPESISLQSFCGFCPFQRYCWDGEKQSVQFCKSKIVCYGDLEDDVVTQILAHRDTILKNWNGVNRELFLERLRFDK